ncbi:MAG: T9SS type A sorting domain-containing protein, partial [Candidatus Poribacteria bacterium]|nr:T9SS type A sorting domain-containing protein [Candidatus Poribacteria bacterium]
VHTTTLTAMLKKMEAVAHFYAYHLKSKPFTYNKSITVVETFDTKPNWESFFENDSQFAGKRLFKYAKDGYEKQHGQGSYTPDQDIYLVVIDHVELGDRIRGGALQNGLGGEAFVSGLDLPWPIIAHELGHTFGLKHQYHNDQYLMSHCGHIEDDFDLSAPFDLDYLIGKIFTDTILSDSDKNWLEVHPAFAKVVPSSANKTTITVVGSINNQVTVSSNNRVKVSIDDPDGIHQIQLLVREIAPNFELSSLSYCQNAYEQGNLQSLKRTHYATISGSPKKRNVNFDVSKLWGNNSEIEITFQVIDSSGDITSAAALGWTTLRKAAQAGPAPNRAEGQQVLIPTETALLVNYPNPFNPETWIPYQLAKPADVKLTIYDIEGRVVRDLDLGHQAVGIYENRSRAAYWDGKNAVGEPVASGVYFYTLTAGDFTATRKPLIRK